MAKIVEETEFCAIVRVYFLYAMVRNVPYYSRPVIFELDENAKTAQILWQYKLPAFSVRCKSINVLGNGNAEYDIAAMLVSPFSSRIQEVTQEAVPQAGLADGPERPVGPPTFRIPSLYPGVEWRITP
jgi:hypothetical protein